MQQTLLSLSFMIGPDAGQYPQGNYIYNILFKFVDVAFLLIDNISVNTGFSQDKLLGSLDLTGISGIKNNQTITIFFSSPLSITI